MTEAVMLVTGLVLVAGIAGIGLIARAILTEMGGQMRALTDSHATQVAALVEAIKTPPGFAALPPDPELTIAAIDKEFAENPASAVQWDSSLQAIPGIDE